MALTSGEIVQLINSKFLYQYLISLHILICVLLIFQFGFLRLKPAKETAKQVKVAIYFCLILPIIQIPISLTRIVFSINANYANVKPIDLYLNFIISPMCSSILIWALQIFIVKKCSCQLTRIKDKELIYKPIKFLAISALGFGWIFSQCLFYYGIEFKTWNNFEYLLTIAILCFTGMVLELLVSSLKYNTINLVSYSVIFAIGTWLYFFKILIVGWG